MPKRKIGDTWLPTVRERLRRRREFEDLVARALDELPEEFQQHLENVEVIVEDSLPPGAMLGLYVGIPKTDRGLDYSGVLPDVITIYRAPIEQRARSRDDLEREVRTTVLHEIAHHFGISDERLRELGYD